MSYGRMVQEQRRLEEEIAEQRLKAIREAVERLGQRQTEEDQRQGREPEAEGTKSRFKRRFGEPEKGKQDNFTIIYSQPRWLHRSRPFLGRRDRRSEATPQRRGSAAGRGQSLGGRCGTQTHSASPPICPPTDTGRDFTEVARMREV